ncbi:MAG: tetratricopeptide repeat protein [Terriglobales bacterium]|jgi:tetratricopeptide (TPR) repeat protein
MSRTRRDRQQRQKAAQNAEAAKAAAAAIQPPVPHAALWLSGAFLLPNLGALACGFLLDDLPALVDNESLHIHSLRQLGHIWSNPYWTDRRGLALYRPVTQTVWALAWAIGHGGHPMLFHAICLALGLAVVLLLYRFLLDTPTPPRTAFIAALLFAVFPIHTEATTSVVGTAELLAAAFGLAALIAFYRGQEPWKSGQETEVRSRKSEVGRQESGAKIPTPYSGLLTSLAALILFALAVFSKESAAAFAAVPLVFPPRNWRSRRSIVAAAGAGAVIAAALFAHHKFSQNSFIPPIDNPMGLLDAFPRILTALWVQCLYIFKTIVPITLSPDYSYKEIPLVMGLDHLRAWAGLALAGGALFLVLRRRQYRAPVLIYAILFASTANVLFSIGTIMGERLAYAPSIGIALLLAILLARSRYWKPILIAAVLLYGTRAAVRNLDWLNADRFYTKQVQTSPHSAKSWYSYGALRSSRGDDAGAIAAYDKAIAIFPAYSEAFHNRGNALVRLGRRQEAMESYRQCLRFDPGHNGARMNLLTLQAGLPLNPPRKHL